MRARLITMLTPIHRRHAGHAVTVGVLRVRTSEYDLGRSCVWRSAIALQPPARTQMISAVMRNCIKLGPHTDRRAFAGRSPCRT